MWLLTQIIAWISSSAFNSLATSVVGVINKRTDANVSINATNIQAGQAVDLAVLNASVAKMHEDAALAALRWGWWGTRWLMVAAAVTPIWHYAQVMLDSCRWVPGILTFYFVPYPWIIEHEVGSWKIAALPGEYAGSELKVIATVVGILVVQNVGGGIVEAITKRK